jgi:hypothetical protein
MKTGAFRFVAGILIGYSLMQGLAFVNANYLWTIFYR